MSDFATRQQPAPTPGVGDVALALAEEIRGGPAMDLLADDLLARRDLGVERYGTPLQIHNGRDALVDAYQEALDLVTYLGQVVLEGDSNYAAGRIAADALGDAVKLCATLRAMLDAREARTS